MRLFLCLILLSLNFKAWSQTELINMLCKMDSGADLRLTIDLENKQMWNTWLLELKPDQEKFKIVKISDSEITAEFKPFAQSKVDGAENFYFSWNLERYTLKISEYGPLGFGRTNNWRRGQCEILKKQI